MTFLFSFGGKGLGHGEFNAPISITGDLADRLVVCDFENHRIQIFRKDGTFLHCFGSKGEGPGQLLHPGSVSCDDEGQIVVVDRGNHRIQIFTQSGEFVRQFGKQGTQEGEFQFPGIVMNREGTLIISDTNNHRIQIFRSDGTFLRTFGTEGKEDGQFCYPSGVTVDSAGNIIVADWHNHRIQWFTAEGMFIRKLGKLGTSLTYFNFPFDVSCGDNDTLVISDGKNNRIQLIRPNSCHIVGKAGSERGEFQTPRGIYVDQNLLYVADKGNHRIQVFTLLEEQGCFPLSAHYYAKIFGSGWGGVRGSLRTAFQLSFRDKEDKLSCFPIETTLGEGSYGVVFLSQVESGDVQTIWSQLSQSEPLRVAIKMQIPIHATTTRLHRYFAREYRTLTNLPLHENIIALFWQFIQHPKPEMIRASYPELDTETVQTIFTSFNHQKKTRELLPCQIVVLEYHPATLQRHLQMYSPLSTFKIGLLSLQLARGLYHLFRNSIVHLDIHPKNLLISKEERLVIADFGTSENFDPNYNIVFPPHEPPGGNASRLSPEFRSAVSHGHQFIPVRYQPSWELGCMLWYFITGQDHPFPEYGLGFNEDFEFPPLDRSLLISHLLLFNGRFPFTLHSIERLADLTISLLNPIPPRTTIKEALYVLQDLKTPISISDDDFQVPQHALPPISSN